MNIPQRWNGAGSIFHRRNVGTVQRVALICLLFGWSAFWAVASLQYCCQLAAKPAHAHVVHAAHADIDVAHAGDHHHSQHPAGSGDFCGSITVVAHAPLAVAAPAPGGAKAANVVYAEMAPPQTIAPRANAAYVAHLPLPPPRAVAPFYLRTSRILI